MALQLRPDELLMTKAQIHWISSLKQTFILLGALALGVATLVVGRDQEGATGRLIFALCMVIFGGFPLLRVWLRNRFNTFTVTNQRIVVEEGFLSRFTTEIALSKINDMTMRQGLLQRLVGAGDIAIFTGNDISTVFKNVDAPENLRKMISRARLKG